MKFSHPIFLINFYIYSKYLKREKYSHYVIHVYSSNKYMVYILILTKIKKIDIAKYIYCEMEPFLEIYI